MGVGIKVGAGVGVGGGVDAAGAAHAVLSMLSSSSSIAPRESNLMRFMRISETLAP